MLARLATALALCLTTPLTATLACAKSPVEDAELVAVTEPVMASEPAQQRMRQRIKAFEAGSHAGQPQMLRLQDDRGQPVYLVLSMCCDQFNPLYDAQGRYICAPSGGFAGGGDGRCPAWARRLKAGVVLAQQEPANPASAPAR
ncbi:DUF6970 domain-containing protein [Roseateles sp. DC23W]|uniref:DUF6970 domain-containing protein n=1 Tax=Pelomonas dachongensis TaxID=3299029 RepID=A0ABW7EQV4_9BURK